MALTLFRRNARFCLIQRSCIQLQQVFPYCDVATIAAKQPFQVALIEGRRYSWCRCGLSKKQPSCDGSHRGTSFQPLRFHAEETSSEVFLCGCKQTGTAPFCDGTHATEEVQSAK